LIVAPLSALEPSGAAFNYYLQRVHIVHFASQLVTISDNYLKVTDPSARTKYDSLREGVQVRGYPGQTFEGHIERISPVADPVTRQVPIFVDIPNAGSRLVAGLFAEGRITREAREGLVVPAGAINTEGARPWVARIRDGRAERVDVTLGLRDERTERVELASGVQAGDRLLVGAAQGISPGTPVRVRAGGAGE